MNNNESLIDRLAEKLESKDPKYPKTVSDIPDFPYSSYAEMISATKEGAFRISKFSYNQEFDALRIVNPKWAMPYTISVLATFLVPILSIAMAFIVSHWFWLGLIYFILGGMLTSRIWSIATISAAKSSEKAFCFLFYCSAICCHYLKSGHEYEWRQLTQQNR